MGLLKQLLGKYVAGGHGGGHGNKHGGGGGGGHHGGNRYGYSDPGQNTYQNTPPVNASGKVCSACNTVNLNTAKFCQQCGKTMSSDCAQCKTALLPDAKFCPQCGTPRGA